MITWLKIKNFRSITTQEIGTNWITTFVGSNDAGKSNILRALNLFFNEQTDAGSNFNFSHDFNRYVVSGKGKAKQIEVTIRFMLPPSYQRKGFPKEVEWKKVWRSEGISPRLGYRKFKNGKNFPNRSKIDNLLDRIRFTYIPAIKDKVFFADLQGQLYDVLASVAAEPLRLSAGAFEAQICEQLKDLLGSINKIFPTESTMQLPDNMREIFENLEISSEGIPLSRRGDGIKVRHIPMLLKFISDKRDEFLNRGGIRNTHIWGFEEPENNVEMSASFDLSNFFTNLIEDSDRFQVFLTTHSPVFYRMDDPGIDEDAPWIQAHFVAKKGMETLIQGRKPSEVDETMGLMPVLAPIVHDFKKKHDLIVRGLEEARDIASRRIPTVLVEGDTDRKVIERSMRLFLRNERNRYNVYVGEADEYGSANAVGSRGLAWALEMRHRSPQDVVRAVALFDDDEAGKKARRDLLENLKKFGIEKRGIVKPIVLPVPDWVRQLRAKGYNVPSDLEACYSREFWEECYSEGMLDERTKRQTLLSDALIEKALSRQVDVFGALDEGERKHLMNIFSDKGKIKAATKIEKLNDEKAKDVLSNFRPAVEIMEEFLFK